MIPLNMHFNKKGFVKIDLGISKGRKKLIKGNIKKTKIGKDKKKDY